MAAALVDIANNALGKVGGAGDQSDGNAFVTAAELTADTTKVAQWINDKYPTVRQRVIRDFAAMKTPFNETTKFGDLDPDLKQYDISIESIAISATVVTITTEDVHGRTTGDTVFLSDIEQDEDETIDDITGALITSLNGTTETITVTTTTAFTIATAGVDATWVHEADTGLVSYVPEIGPWLYAYTLPSDYFAMVRQTDQLRTTRNGVRTAYQHDVIVNKDSDGFLMVSNTNSRYIDYCIDQTTFALFSTEFEECMAMLLAAELCPIVGRDLATRQSILAEYKALTIPEAKRNIVSQENTFIKTPTDYLGGRDGSFVRGYDTDLGTYVKADGTRADIYP